MAKKQSADKKKKTQTAPQQPPSNSEKEVDNAVPRPLPGCLLPGCFFVLILFGLLIYLLSYCVMTARYPGKVPAEVYIPVNFLRFYSDEFYRLTELGYRKSGGKEDPFVRGQSYTRFRAHLPNDGGGRTVYLVDNGFADVYQVNHAGLRTAGERIPIPGSRAAFLRKMRKDGEYYDELPIPSVSFYRKGLLLRKRAYPVMTPEKKEYNMDCYYVNEAPYTGITMAVRSDVYDPYRIRAVTYLRGKVINNLFFPERGYYRGPEAYGDVKTEEVTLLEYEFGRDRSRLTRAAESQIQLLRLVSARNRFQWKNGEKGLPDSILQMAVRKNDYDLVKKLLRHDLIRKELSETKRNPAANGWTCLHDAAIQNNVPVLAAVIPLYPEIDLKEKQWGATPFLAAVMADRYENVLLFLRREDKKVNQTLSDGSTALHLTAETMSPVMAELLLSHGANKKLRNRAGNTPYQHLLKEMKRQGLDESNPDAAKLMSLLQ